MIKATRCRYLGARGTERYVNGAYRRYVLPEGYDFLKFDDVFCDKYVVGKDGTIWIELKTKSTENELIYKKMEAQKDGSGKRSMRVRRGEMDKRIAISKIVYETFTPGVNARDLTIIRKNGDQTDDRYENLAVKEEEYKPNWIDAAEEMKRAGLTMNKIMNFAKSKKCLGEYYSEMKTEERMGVIENAALEALCRYRKGANTLYGTIKMVVKWRLTDYLRKTKGKIIYSLNQIEEKGVGFTDGQMAF